VNHQLTRTAHGRGHPLGLLDLIGETQPHEPWEAAVTACLTLLCEQHRKGKKADQSVAYRRFESTSTAGLAVFRTRLDLSLVDGYGGVTQPAGRAVAASLLNYAVTDG
jgi:hypothetical protein